ncbi:MAG TPA: DNA repair protein RecN [Candidatus Dormibacteraeota bacterium]|nr:DNA repair protein RecN [Candidatus Dormibacteraeota bacterium]
MTNDDGATSAGPLLELAVSDLALVERLRLQLRPGLNVITGETGAGKSLLIDALGLALGGRADTSLVRHGAEAARVEALFERLPEPLIVVREVTAAGRSTARIDDVTVTAARLAEQVRTLVDVHGQHDQQHLLDERRQRDLLDAYGGLEEAVDRVRSAVERWRVNRAALAALALDPREVARRLDLMEHEAAEIASARLRPGEAAGIESRLAAARHGEAIALGAAEADAALVEDAGARDLLARAAGVARRLARLDARWEGLAERLGGLEAELVDAAADARELAATVEHDPAELARLEERLSEIYALERRYGDDEAAVIAHGERCRAEAERLRGLEVERAARATEDAVLLRAVGDAAAVLATMRREAAGRLATDVGAALVALGFRADAFEVSLGRRTARADEPAVEIDGDALAFDASGIDTVVYRFAPNAGEPARPLARIASGGELSRVALAIRQVLADVDDTPTLVFDEIDAGIGARSAEPVGRSLWALARRHQVLCVTHLGQIAAYADAHFQIAKRERDGRTATEIRLLDRDGRIVELAHMLAGPAGGPTALASARELLDRAEGWRGEALARAG